MFALPKADYRRYRHVLDAVPFNTLFAQAVFDRPDDGEIFTDDPKLPGLFHVRHRYGMSLLLGQPAGEAAAGRVLDHLLAEARHRPEWLQFYPSAWEEMLLASLQGRPACLRDLVKSHRRQNFRHDGRRPVLPTLPGVEIRPMGRDSLAAMAGSVVPSGFWNSAADFLARGRGFDLFHGGVLAAQAFSAFVIGRQVEIGIETRAEWRRRGLAALVAGSLVVDCLERELTPVWSCRQGNLGSYRLACRLGFVPSVDLPYLQFG